MKKLLLFMLALCISFSEMNAIRIYSNYPGGNLIIDRIDGDNIYVRPDLRDTEGWWFYWNFGVADAKGKTLTFIFTSHTQFSEMGAAISKDKGMTWNWLGGDAVDTNQFSYTFTSNDEVRFSMGMPYTQANYEAFIEKYKGNPAIKHETLCQTKKGRLVEMLKIKNPEATPKEKVLIVTRNHSCEMMGSYVMEGIISAVLDSPWLLDHMEFLFVPFMDKDGVEDGDPGKNRLPRDHNRDYSEISIHETTAALREYVPVWSENKLKYAFDLHCPWIKDGNNEYIFLIGSIQKEMAKKQVAFSDLLEKNRKGELNYYTKNMVWPGDYSWNDPKLPTKGDTFVDWASKTKGIEMATCIEFPYSYSSKQVVTANNARDFGKDVAHALELYVKQSIK